MSQLDFSITLKFCIGLIEEASNFSKSDSGFAKAFSYFESFYFAWNNFLLFLIWHKHPPTLKII